MGRPAASVGAAAGRVSVWRRDSGARHGCTVAKRIPATCMVVVRGIMGGCVSELLMVALLYVKYN